MGPRAPTARASTRTGRPTPSCATASSPPSSASGDSSAPATISASKANRALAFTSVSASGTAPTLGRRICDNTTRKCHLAPPGEGGSYSECERACSHVPVPASPGAPGPASPNPPRSPRRRPPPSPRSP
eukprot:335228_1